MAKLLSIGLLVLFVSVAMAATDDTKPPHVVLTEEELNKMVEVKLKDGTTEKVTVRELSKRMQSNEKLLEVMSNKAKAPETETGTIKLDEIQDQKPELGSFIKRAQETFKILIRNEIVPEGSKMTGLATSDVLSKGELPEGEEAMVFRWATANGKAQASIEVHTKYIQSHHRLVLLGAWKLDDGGRRKSTIDLTKIKGDSLSWSEWSLQLLEQSNSVGLLLISIGVGLMVFGAIGFLLSAPSRKAPSTVASKKSS